MGSTSTATPEVSSDGGRSQEQDTAPAHLSPVDSCPATSSEAGCPAELNTDPAHPDAAGSCPGTGAVAGCSSEQDTAPAHMSLTGCIATDVGYPSEFPDMDISPRPKNRLAFYREMYMQMRAECMSRDPLSDPDLAPYLRRERGRDGLRRRPRRSASIGCNPTFSLRYSLALSCESSPERDS